LIAAGCGNWQWDITTDTVTWSERLYRIAGCDPGTRLPPIKTHSHALLQVLTTGLPLEMEWQMVRPNGMIRRMVSSGEAARDFGNHILQLYGSVEYITGRNYRELDRNQPSLSTGKGACQRGWASG
jgi:PAS domain-containing protein